MSNVRRLTGRPISPQASRIFHALPDRSVSASSSGLPASGWDAPVFMRSSFPYAYFLIHLDIGALHDLGPLGLFAADEALIFLGCTRIKLRALRRQPFLQVGQGQRLLQGR